jgi:site-specific DNA-cytosine methylase
MSAKSFRGADSKINECMWHFVRYAAKIKPIIAVFESVQPAYRRDDGRKLMRQLRAELEELTGEQYGLWHILHNAYSIGGPAQRRRYFWLVSRVSFGIEKPTLRYLPTLDDVIGDLESLANTWYPQPYRSPTSSYARQFMSPSGIVDGMATIPHNIGVQRLHDLMNTVSWKPGDHIALVARRYYEMYGHLPKSFGPEMEAKIVKNNFNMGFTTPTRWDGSKHSRVVTGASLYCTIHPHLNRTITHREAARILGFPDDWHALPLRNISGIQTTWGKGITCHCGKWIGSWIKRALDGDPGSLTGDNIGDREKVLDITNTWKTVVLQSTGRTKTSTNGILK